MYTDGEGKQFRCGSISCRPGDPYGCSMIGARYRADQAEHILKGWIASGGYIYLTLCEVTGGPTDSLRSVLTAGRAAINAAFGGSKWARAVRELDVAGQIRTLGVTRSASGAWILRRWVVVGVSADLGEELERQSSQINARWTQSLERSALLLAKWRAMKLKPVSQAEVSAISQLVTGCESPHDPPKRLTKLLREHFELGRSERTGSDLAAEYRAHSGPIAEWFADQERGDYRSGLSLRDDGGIRRVGVLVRQREKFVDKHGETSETRKRPSAEGRFIRIGRIPTECEPFIEYATSLQGVRVWSANRARSGSPSWNELVEQAAKLSVRYVSKPERVSAPDSVWVDGGMK